VAAQCINPDYGIVVETTSCADFLEEREWNRSTISGGGAVVYLMESSAYYRRETVEKITSTADKKGILWQYKTVTVGGTDAGSVQRSGLGAEVMTIATPCRNLHCGACTMCYSDFTATSALLAALLDTKF
jgi:endoglucanase